MKKDRPKLTPGEVEEVALAVQYLSKVQSDDLPILLLPPAREIHNPALKKRATELRWSWTNMQRMEGMEAAAAERLGDLYKLESRKAEDRRRREFGYGTWKEMRAVLTWLVEGLAKEIARERIHIEPDDN